MKVPKVNNIQKAFKEKSKLRGMADGGIYKNTVDGVPTFTDSKYAAAGATKYAPGAPPAAAPQQLPTMTVQPPASPLRATPGLPTPTREDAVDLSGISSSFSNRSTPIPARPTLSQTMPPLTVQAPVIDTSSFFADTPVPPLSIFDDKLAGFQNGGKVVGPGTGTSDDVGPVMLSHGEYVLPADTVQHVGKENLDALRDATHDYNPQAKPLGPSPGGHRYGARKMADGGLINKRPGLGGFIRGAPAFAAVAGAGESMADTMSGRREELNNQIGGDASPMAATGADTARTFSNIGNALTFGGAGRLGAGLSNMAAGQSFATGFAGSSPRDAIAQREMDRVMSQPPPAAASPLRTSAAPTPVPTTPGSYQSNRLAEMGVAPAQQNAAPVADPRAAIRGGSQEFSNLGSYGGNSNIYGRSSAPGGRMDTFVGVGGGSKPENGSTGAQDPVMSEVRNALRNIGGNNGGSAPSYSSNANDINQRYDKLAKDLGGMYSARGQGNLSKRLLDLEQQRNSALDADARNISSLRGQDVSASTSSRNANLQAQMQGAQIMSTMATQRNAQNADLQAAQLKALQDAQKTSREGEEKGFSRYTDAIGSMFIDSETGKPNAGEQEKFTSFLQASDPRAMDKFSAMPPQEQMTLLQNFKTLYDMNKARNDTASRSGRGAVTNRADMPADVREATFDDVWNNNLPASDYIWSNLPFTNPNVVVGESGQPTLLSKAAVDADGNWDADKLKLIEDRTGKDRKGKRAGLREK